MTPAAGAEAKSKRVVPQMLMQTTTTAGMMAADTTATHPKDALIAWFRGEFAAANAIIDALCSHLVQLECGGGDGVGRGGSDQYDSVFAAIHQRRLNWIPILHMQKYCSIADVALELRKVGTKKAEERKLISPSEKEKARKKVEEEIIQIKEANNLSSSFVEKEKIPGVSISEEDIIIPENTENGNGGDEDSAKGDSPESEITDTGSQEVQQSLENIEICSNHEDCEARREQIKITKGFVAKQPVRGHMMNVVRGLKLYEDVFTDIELSKLKDFVNELRVAGQNGELSGETFIMYNQQLKGSKRELIQLGVPIFGQIKEESGNKYQRSDIEPIPPILQDIIEHLVQWHIISESRRPNGCIINFFDEDEYSQPFLKPPHLDQPISTLLLSESSMAFGRTVMNDNEGNYRGPLMLSLREGSLLVMRGNSADIARHVMCSSPNKRVSITFVKIRTETESSLAPIPSPTRAMSLWHPGSANPQPTPNGAINDYEQMGMIPKWGALRAPVLMLAPLRPVVMAPRRISRVGTGVFLPWTVGSRKPAKHLPPRAQRGRLLALPSPIETCKAETASDPSISSVQTVH